MHTFPSEIPVIRLKRLTRVLLMFTAGLSCGTASGQLTWTQADNSSPTPRYFHAMAFDSVRNRVVLFGGNTGETDTWEWDTTSNSWQLMATAGPPRRGGHAMVFDPVRRVTVLAGGWYRSPRQDVWEWNGTSWSPAPALPQARNVHGMVYDTARNRVVLYGGTDVNPAASQTLEYNGQSWTAVNTPFSPGVRFFLGMSYDSTANRTILAAEGSPWPFAPTELFQYRFDSILNAQNWQSMEFATESPVARQRPVLFYDSARNETVMHGGIIQVAQGRYRGVGETWVLSGDRWTLRGFSIPQVRHAIAYDSNRREALSYSGNFGTCACTSFRALFAWNGSEWSTRWDGGSPEPTFDPAFAYDSRRGVTVMYGGLRLNPSLFIGIPPLGGNVWEWNGARWTFKQSTANPGTRHRTTLVFDQRRGVTVLHGGSPGNEPESATNDTWEYDGENWRPSISAPFARAMHGAIYDTTRERMIVFGGRDGSGLNLRDTWSFNGATWQQLSSAGPSPRNRPAMAYDSRRDRVVLFGGSDNASVFGDTWEWNGSAWNQVSLPPGTPVPPARRGGHMAYDPDSGLTVLYAGQASNNTQDGRDDVWSFDGIRWRQLAASPAVAKISSGFAYDSQRKLFVLAGGSSLTDINFTTGQTWEASFPCAGPPVIVRQPDLRSVCRNGLGVIEVGVRGSGGPYRYSWRKDGVPISEVPNRIAGTSTAVLQLTRTIASDAGVYDVVITTPCGNVTSQSTTLTVCIADFNCSGLVDFFDYLDFVQAYQDNSPSADIDGNGQIDFFDYLEFVSEFARGDC